MATTSPPTLLELLDRYICERQLADRTVQSMREIVGAFQQFVGDPLPVSELTDDLVNRWLSSLQRAGRAPNTLKNRRVAILTMWRYAYELELIDYLPRRVKRFRAPTTIPVCFSPDEFAALFQAAADIKGPAAFFTRPAIDRRLLNLRNTTKRKRNGGENERVIPVRHSLFWLAWLRTQYDSGLRFGDLIKLRRIDIQRDGSCALVQTKSGHVIRFTLRPETLAAIKRIAPKNPSEPIFDVASRRVIMLHFARLVKSVGLTGGTHKVRKTSATMLEAAHPGSAMAHLGHKTPGLAYKTYVDPRFVQQNKPLPPAIGEREGGAA